MFSPKLKTKGVLVGATTALLLLGSVGASTAAPAPTAHSGTITITSGGAPVHKTAMMSSERVGELKGNQTVDAACQTENDGMRWFKITNPANPVGYVSRDYVRDSTGVINRC